MTQRVEFNSYFVFSLFKKRSYLVFLSGSNPPRQENNVVQWTHESGDAITHQMGYDKGQLLVEKEGYYYLYSKVQLNAVLECSLILHKVMKDTSAYGLPIELMRSKRLVLVLHFTSSLCCCNCGYSGASCLYLHISVFGGKLMLVLPLSFLLRNLVLFFSTSLRCRTPKPVSVKALEGEDLWNSFLAGIFHLQIGDKVFVTLDNIQKIRTGPTDNFMGAFMIFP